MAVHIRLQRKGKKHRPFYHVVCADQKAARDGKYLERLGHYDPMAEPSVVELKGERMQYWYSKGAQLSEAVAKLAKIKNLKLSRTLQA